MEIIKSATLAEQTGKWEAEKACQGGGYPQKTLTGSFSHPTVRQGQALAQEGAQAASLKGAAQG